MSHMWGDFWFEKHGEDLYTAINYCMRTWRRYGRIGTNGKEKYGQFVDSASFWDGGLHGLIYPGYYWVRFPFLYFKVDRYLIQPFTRYTGIHKLGLLWQKTVYNYAIQKMCKRYPELTDELVSDLDYYEFVKPGIFGKVDGTVIHKKYWTSGDSES